MPKLSEILFGKKSKMKKLKTVSPEQEQLMSLITEGLTSGEGPFGELFGGFNQQNFDEGVKKPALNMFQNEILPQIQEKFIAGNQVLGSGLRRAQMKGATDLQDKLAQLMYQAQQDSQRNKMGGLQTALGTRTFENVYKPGTQGALQGLMPSLGSTIGSIIAG